MTDIDTCSTLPRVDACPASACLPHVDSAGEDAAMGLAIHEHLDHRAKYGVDEALRRLDDVAKSHDLGDKETGIFKWRCRGFEWCPPAGSFGEVALALREDGSVDRVKLRRQDHRYTELDGSPLRTDTVTAGTLDCMWSEDEPLDISDPSHPKCPPGSILWVPDWKSGEEANVPPAERNMQLAALVVMAAKWTGATHAVPAIVFVRPGQGEWDVPDLAWGPRELANAELRVRDVIRRRKEQQARLDAGETLEFNETRYCTYCPGQTFCPAKVAMLKMVMGSEPPTKGAQLTPDERRFWAQRLPHLRSLVARFDEVLKADVLARGEVEVGDDLVWGPVREATTSIDGARALPVLQEQLGDDAAGIISVSKKSIQDAIKAKHAREGKERAVAGAMRDILKGLAKVDAIRKGVSVTFKAHRREAPQLASGDVIDGDE